jgi:hypothetical protein
MSDRWRARCTGGIRRRPLSAEDESGRGVPALDPEAKVQTVESFCSLRKKTGSFKSHYGTLQPKHSGGILNAVRQGGLNLALEEAKKDALFSAALHATVWPWPEQ